MQYYMGVIIFIKISVHNMHYKHIYTLSPFNNSTIIAARNISKKK